MVEMKCVGDIFEMLMTDFAIFVNNIPFRQTLRAPISQRSPRAIFVAKIRKLPPILLTTSETESEKFIISFLKTFLGIRLIEKPQFHGIEII